ncbi:hypothetical protein ACFFRR_004616 [Megaselia abdita]
MITEIALFIVAAFGVFYLWVRERYKYFEKLGIEYAKPTFLVGSQKEVFFQQQNFFDSSEPMYKFGKSSIIGIFETIQPIYLFKSPELCRQIFIKDFTHFVDHRKFFNDDGLFDHSLIQLEGDKWKEMRSTLSPAYTGNKMRGMFELIREIAQQASLHLKEKELGKDVNLKEFFSRFANDVIASTAFGFKINSLEDKDNEFYKMGKEVTVFSSFDMIKFLALSFFNKYCKYLGISIMSKRQNNYYMNLVLGAMKNRKDQKIFRPDMINMLMEVRGIGVQGTAEYKSHYDWTDKEIVAQCFIFFFAGFDTVSTILSFLGHEIMVNPEVQERLKEEIMGIHNDGPLTYEALGKMKYTEAVIYETLRMWPAVPFLDRRCTKAIDLVDTETGKIVKLKQGDQIVVPIVGIHRDEKYFPEPLKFDPERFSEENKHNIPVNAFMPFGIGPRMCIGNRFAIMEMKALLFYLMKDVSFEKSEKSTIPMALDPASAQMEPKGGFMVKVVGETHQNFYIST